MRLETSLIFLLLLPCVVAQAETPAPEQKTKPKKLPTQEDVKSYEMKAWKTISGSAKQVDECTQRYTEEFPDRKGTVDLKFDKWSKDGTRLDRVEAKSTLTQTERMETCLKTVALHWRFPPWAFDVPPPLKGLPIKVQKGLKFSLLKPGEKPPEQKAEAQKKPEGFISFGSTWQTTAGYGEDEKKE